jgi:hypothetical protein
MTKLNVEHTSLVDASPSIKLAVDLIQLLENNQIETEVVLQALKIVTKDYQRKQKLNLENS